MAEIVAGRAARQDDVASLQLEDLRAVGGILLQLACAALPHPSLEICAAQYSADFTRIVASLLGQQSAPIVNWRQARHLFRVLKRQQYRRTFHMQCRACSRWVAMVLTFL